jgi:hypothetical protein
MVETLYSHICKWKNETAINYSRNWGAVKESEGGEFKYDVL